MRFEGTLAKWNDERGFGFIVPDGTEAGRGGQEIFIHISAFPHDGRRPRVGEALSFEIDLNRDGKKRAVNVLRAANGTATGARDAGRATMPSRPPRLRSEPHRQRGAWRTRAIAVALLIAVIAYGYEHYQKTVANHRAALERVMPLTAAQTPSGVSRASPMAPYRCDGRTYCSQMTSCAEARFFLKSCPNTQMDGNHDGVPCEQQWCR
jgi:cold shock CspA family protein